MLDDTARLRELPAKLRAIAEASRIEKGRLIPLAEYLIWAADRIEALEAGLRKVDSAWDALPGDKFHSPKVVESWLSVHMAPAIRAARDLLKGAGDAG